MARSSERLAICLSTKPRHILSWLNKHVAPEASSAATTDQGGSCVVAVMSTDIPLNSEPGTENGNCVSISKDEVGWRRAIRNFTPSWFAVNMGTGVVSILLHTLPYNARWISHGVAIAFFVLNIVVFIIFTVMSIMRYTLYPEIWTAMLGNHEESILLGCFPMGLATIIDMMISTCYHWGDWLLYLAWALWWFDVILSVATCTTVPFIIFRRQKPRLDAVTANFLFPNLPVIVAAGEGSVVANALPSKSHAMTTLITCYVLWGIGECFTGLVLALYLHRLTVHGLPPRETIVSVFLPLGPLGQGGFGIQHLGIVALKLSPSSASSVIAAEELRSAAGPWMHGGEILHVLGTFLALCMWGFGVVWLSLAVFSLAALRRFPFNVGWWGFTFPLGVLATCTGILAESLDSVFFRVMTMIFSLSVCLLWLMVAVGTLQRVWTGVIFQAPCIRDLREKERQRVSDGRV
ncbi:hypothetical protein SODALDRAFT_376410 [Sodiomyces alkalinus F11]|uniref:Sulfite efflux pump SSU1 n=1 Tax=Sodiomyces alkalinus (strain CBS 110278 / VKM F-3762 / F11) TaxID=1314773 RepID=A0A3N2Q1Y8_SODAK|nr:hypothetical protein SODALDRAFT_376410 [Sodiomyces alkalinus F11]ROT40635.1 hypothetical protein SODALDRAFT_376410 [Sodiomyces alkalinus F11]